MPQTQTPPAAAATVPMTDVAGVMGKVATFVRNVGEFAQTVKAAEDERRTKLAAAEAKIPEVVAAMVEHGRIDKSEVKAAEEVLRDPVAMMDLLKGMADPVAGMANAPMGGPVPATKTASFGPAGSGGQEDANAVFDSLLFGGSAG